MKIIILLLVSIILNASEPNYKFNSELELAWLSNEKLRNTGVLDKQHVEYVLLTTRFQYTYDNFTFKMTPFFMTYDTNDGRKIYNCNIDLYYDYRNFFFHEFYVKYDYENHSIGAGLLPFNENSFIEYRGDYVKKGEGLSTLVESTLSTMFYTYKFNENSHFKIGYGRYNWLKIIPKGDFIYKPNSRSGVYWSSFDFKAGKFYSYNQLIYVDAKYKGKEVAKVGLLGLGLAYDDSEYSGLSIYDILAGSVYKNNSINVKDDIMKMNKIPQEIVDMYPFQFGFDNETLIGWSNLLGIRKDFDLKYETFINFEWFHTSDNWYSFNNGTPYSANCNTRFNIRNDSFMGSIGVRFSENLTFKALYTVAEYKESSVVGTPAKTIPVEIAIGEETRRMKHLLLRMNYKF